MSVLLLCVAKCQRHVAVAVTCITLTVFWQMRELSLKCNSRMTDEGVSAVLGNMPGMRVLDLSVNAGIEDVTMRRLQNMSGLTRLTLATVRALLFASRVEGGLLFCDSDYMQTGISDEGIPYISSLHKLSYLDLSRTDITDRAIEVIAPMEGLSTLLLHYTAVTDEGIKFLAESASLQTLNVTGCSQVTDEGVHCKV